MRELEEPTLTTREAADLAGVTTSGLLHMETRGKLTDRAGRTLAAERNRIGHRMWTYALVKAALVWRWRAGKIDLATLRERARHLNREARNAEAVRRDW